MSGPSSRRSWDRKFAAAFLFLSFAPGTIGQTTANQTVGATASNQRNKSVIPAQADDNRHASLVPSVFAKNLAQDQKEIWTSPFKLRIQGLNWLVPFAGITAGLIAS